MEDRLQQIQESQEFASLTLAQSSSASDADSASMPLSVATPPHRCSAGRRVSLVPLEAAAQKSWAGNGALAVSPQLSDAPTTSPPLCNEPPSGVHVDEDACSPVD